MEVYKPGWCVQGAESRASYSVLPCPVFGPQVAQSQGCGQVSRRGVTMSYFLLPLWDAGAGMSGGSRESRGRFRKRCNCTDHSQLPFSS
jgi:hypothetical protein